MQRPARTEELESSWIHAAARGDQEAASALVKAHERVLWLLLWRLSGSRSEAEDLFQEVWLAAWKALPRFRGESRFSTWLTQIAIHATRKRGAKRESGFAREVERIATDLDSDPARSAERSEAAQFVERALAPLAPREREALVLHYLHEYSFADVALLMGVQVSTARKAAWDGMQRARSTTQRDLQRGAS